MSNRVYSALDIAEYIVFYCYKNNLSINPLRLQRLLYFVQAYFLICSNGDKIAFVDEIEAWDIGPVVPKIYHVYKRFGSGQIPFYNNYNINKLFDEDKELIEEVINKCKNKSDVYLMELTHQQKPWQDAYKSNDRYTNQVITQSSIIDYFIKEN